MSIRIFITVFLVIVVFETSSAQYTQYASKDKKALKYYEEARQYLKRAQFIEALEPLNDALNRDPDFIEVWLSLGSAHYRMGRDSLSKYYFQQALKIDPDYEKSKYAYQAIGEYFFKSSQYDSASAYLKHYLRTEPGDPRKEAVTRDLLRNCQFALRALANPFEYQIELLPDHANYFSLQYFASLSVDQKQLYFTRREGIGHDQDEDIFYTSLQADGTWAVPESISNTINTTENEGAASVSADGRTLVFTSCSGRMGYGSCDIYVSYKEGDDWSEPKNIGDEINSESWEAQPSLSADGRTIYFVSNRANGYGGKDIWVASKNRRGKWQPAYNAGKVINSTKDEISPFIHANGESLYFASEGHEGLGGLDIFLSELQDSIWTDPLNLGVPLNDSHDQVSLYIAADGRTGVYTKETEHNYQFESKLYSLILPDSFRVTNQCAYLQGMVSDSETGDPLAAQIEIYKLNDPNYYSELNSDRVNGSYTLVLTEGNQYGVYVTCSGYVFHDFSFVYDDVSTFDKNLLNIELKKVRPGVKTVLGNIFFDFDEYTLQRESMSELKVVYYFLRSNPGVKVEISGHTDSKGSASYNLQLSEKRAQNVFDFLVSKGISERQLSYKGYGHAQPISTQNTPESHARNRRIEFKILSVGD